MDYTAHEITFVVKSKDKLEVSYDKRLEKTTWNGLFNQS